MEHLHSERIQKVPQPQAFLDLPGSVPFFHLLSIDIAELHFAAEWNPDPEIARVAEQLYNHPDNLELFVGLMAEEAKPSMPGSGLAPGYTISR